MVTGGSGNANWQNLGVPGSSAMGGLAQTGGGGFSAAGFHSLLDMRRSAAGPGRVPYAEYPDGYLGNVNSRREDRLLQNIQSRLTQRSYQRGVHKGERIDPQDYYWNDVLDPQSGLRAEARGQRWTAVGATPEQQVNHMGKNHLLSPQQLANVANSVGLNAPNEVDPIRSARMQRLLPSWK